MQNIVDVISLLLSVFIGIDIWHSFNHNFESLKQWYPVFILKDKN